LNARSEVAFKGALGKKWAGAGTTTATRGSYDCTHGGPPGSASPFDQELNVNKLIIGLAAAGAIWAVSSSPTAASAGSSCPPGGSGYFLWDTSMKPYTADNAVDEHGNADGWVCAQPKKTVIDENGNPFQLYNFIDNRSSAG
jgi:hypothetical protein